MTLRFFILKVMPYIMLRAESHMIAAVEQQVLCLDAGHGSEDCEDSEPIPTSDPWVQGTLPVVHVPPKALQVRLRCLAALAKHL